MSLRTLIILALALDLAGTSTAPASGQMKTPARNTRNSLTRKTDPDSKDTPETQHTTIALISRDSITISTGKETKVFKVDQETEIELKGSRATLADLKPGMRVSITPGVDASLAGYILASDPPKDPKTAGYSSGKK